MRQRLAVGGGGGGGGGGGWRWTPRFGLLEWDSAPSHPHHPHPPSPPPSLSPAVQLPGTDSDGGGRLRAAEPAEGRREGRRRRRRRSPREAAAAEWGRRSGLGMSPRQVRVHIYPSLAPSRGGGGGGGGFGKGCWQFWWRRWGGDVGVGAMNGGEWAMFACRWLLGRRPGGGPRNSGRSAGRCDAMRCDAMRRGARPWALPWALPSPLPNSLSSLPHLTSPHLPPHPHKSHPRPVPSRPFHLSISLPPQG